MGGYRGMSGYWNQYSTPIWSTALYETYLAEEKSRCALLTFKVKKIITFLKTSSEDSCHLIG